MEEKTYALNPGRIKTTVIAFIVMLLGSSILDLIIFQPIPNGTLPVNIAGVVLLSAVIGVLVFFINKEAYLKICENGVDHIVGKKEAHYPFADFLGVNVIKHSTNGIYTGTTRYMKFRVPGKDDKTVNINCSRLKAAQFDEIVAHLSKNEFAQSESKEELENLFDTEKLFDIPKETIIKKNKSKSLLVNVVVIVTAIILELVMYFACREISILTAILVCAVIAVITGVVIALRVKMFAKFRNQVPERITIDNYTLAVDGRTFPAERTIKVVMTLPNDDTKDRILLITTNDKTVARYSFARLNNMDPAESYSEYSKLYSMIKYWCLQRDISFMASLG